MESTGAKEGQCDGNTQLIGVGRDLGDKPGRAIGSVELRGGATQGLAFTDKLVDILVLIWDLGLHRLPQQAKELLQRHTFEQVEEGGIAGNLGQLRIERHTKRLMMGPGKTLQVLGAVKPLRTPINNSNHWG